MHYAVSVCPITELVSELASLWRDPFESLGPMSHECREKVKVAIRRKKLRNLTFQSKQASSLKSWRSERLILVSLSTVVLHIVIGRKCYLSKCFSVFCVVTVI